VVLGREKSMNKGKEVVANMVCVFEGGDYSDLA
jgi:hypothetical protein